MSNLINKAVIAANVIMADDNLGRSGRVGEGREVSVAQEKKEKEGGGREEKQAGKKTDEEEDDEDVEDCKSTMDSTHSPFLSCLFFKTHTPFFLMPLLKAHTLLFSHAFA